MPLQHPQDPRVLVKKGNDSGGVNYKILTHNSDQTVTVNTNLDLDQTSIHYYTLSAYNYAYTIITSVDIRHDALSKLFGSKDIKMRWYVNTRGTVIRAYT